jgi:hypothetical protein
VSPPPLDLILILIQILIQILTFVRLSNIDYTPKRDLNTLRQNIIIISISIKSKGGGGHPLGFVAKRILK